MNCVCKIPHCINDAQMPTMGICKACYSSMLAARHKTPAQRLKRLTNLAKYQARTEIMNGSVSTIRRKPVVLTVLPGSMSKRLTLVKRKKIYANG